jgi:nucleoid DNA-binding protein
MSFLKIFAGQTASPVVSQPAPFANTVSPMATVTKRELVVKISNETGLTQQQVFDVIQKTLDSITDALSSGDTVVMRNFGAFQVKETKAKIGRNPKDPGKDVPIPARAVVKFKPGKEMKEQVSTTLPLIREREAQADPEV